MAKLGYAIAFIIWLFMGIMAVAFYFVGTLLPSLQLFFIALMYVLILVSGFVLMWAFTVEGNTFYLRVLGGKNIIINMLLENGKFLRFIQVDASKSDYEYDKVNYRNKQAAFLFRRGAGTPYQIHRQNENEPIDITNLERTIDASQITAYIKEKLALMAADLWNSIYEQFRIMLIIGLVLTAAGFIYMIFGPLSDILNDTSNTEALVRGMYNHIVTVTPMPQPGAIPNA